MPMTKRRGKDLEVLADAVVISDEGTSFEVTQESQEIDTTTFGDTSKTALPDDPNLTATLTGYDTIEGPAALDLNIGDEITALVWRSKVTGGRTSSAPAVVLSKNENFEVNGVAGWQMTFKINAAPTTGTVA